MLILGSPESVSRISDPYVRALAELRLEQLGNFDDGLVIVSESGDSPEELARVSGIDLLHDPFEDVPYGHPDFTPTFDFLEEHEHVYEIHIDTGDDGIGVTFFVPKPAGEGGSSVLVAFCKAYATPAVTV